MTELEERKSSCRNYSNKMCIDTSIFDVFVLIVPILFTIYYSTLFVRIFSIDNKYATFFIEFSVIVCTIIFQVTIWGQHYWEVMVILLCTTAISILFWAFMKMPKVRSVKFSRENAGYVTVLRAAINLITSVCILAVDFDVFPRSMAKSYAYGSTLMDTGIGLFVFSSGIVCKRLPREECQSVKSFLRLIWGCFPLIALGVARTVVLKFLHYGQSVSEYGLHWNAFIALAITRIFGTLVGCLAFQRKHLMWIAIATVLLHEIVLQNGIADYVLFSGDSRKHFIPANREGIYSIPGYIALYLASAYIGIALNSGKKVYKFKEFLDRASVLTIVSVILWEITFILEPSFNISRRVVNSGYVLWILAIAVSMTTLFMFVEVFTVLLDKNLSKEKQTTTQTAPTLMEAINYNGLAFFLFANFLTGFVNMTLNPGKRDTISSLIILVIYMLLLCIITVVLFLRKIKIKL